MIGDNIKRIREAKGIGVNDLAKMANINASYISALENNKKSNPSTKYLRKIATALQVDPSAIFHLSENSYSVELLTSIQRAYGNTFEPIGAVSFLNLLVKELNIESDLLFSVYNNKSTDLPLVIQTKLLNYLKTLDIKIYSDIINEDTIKNHDPHTIDVDNDLKTIIEIYKNASIANKTKMYKMIELLNDKK